MDSTAWADFLAALAAGLGTAAAFGALGQVIANAQLRRRRAAAAAADSLDAKLARLRSAATDLRAISNEVVLEAEAQLKVAADAAAEAQRNQRLASLSAEQAAGVAELLEAAGDRQGRASKRTTIIWAIVSIVASNVVSIAVTVWTLSASSS